MIKPVQWWTVCGKCSDNKRFVVTAMSNLSNPEIEKVFIEKHKVHLFPSRCETHYDEQIVAEAM